MKAIKKIIKNVDRMRANSRKMAMYRNLPIARETFALLEELDDPDEGPLGKALACNAMLHELSEYDTPRFVLQLLRREKEWLEESEEKSEDLTAEEVQHEIEKLEAYIDVDGITPDEFCEKYGRYLRFDPVERWPLWEEIWYEVEEECDRRTKGQPRGMGFCFAYWSAKRAVLSSKYGIDWRSPNMMNPRVMFD